MMQAKREVVVRVPREGDLEDEVRTEDGVRVVEGESRALLFDALAHTGLVVGAARHLVTIAPDR